MGRRSQAVQRERRLAAVDNAELANMLANPPPGAGDAIGALTWHCFRTGQVTRWTVLRGDRRNNYRLRSPDGRQSRSHGLAWLLAGLRKILLRLL